MRAVLFDLDGVLIDSYGAWHGVINAFARDHGYPRISDETMELGWGQSVDADAEMFFPGTAAADLERYYDAHLLDHMAGLVITPGAGEVFGRLRSVGCKTAIVTNTPHELTQRLLEKMPFDPDEAIGTSESLRAKPAPDMLLQACDLLGATPADAFMVGDSAFDRDAAATARTPFLAYRWDGGRRVDELEEIVDLVRKGLGD